MWLSLQNTADARVQCETWLSNISNTGSSLVGPACRAKCFNHSGNSSEFIKPDSVTNAQAPVGKSKKRSAAILFLGKIKAGGTFIPDALMQHTAVTV
jgi:hypothetical protein